MKSSQSAPAGFFRLETTMSGILLKDIFRLGWPMFIGQMAVMANGFIDTIMAGRYSTLDLAGIGVGASIYMSIFVAMMGILLALTPTAAQLYGAGRYGEIGEEVRQCSWLALALSLLCFLVLRFPDPFIALTHLEPEVEVRTRAYLAALSWAVPASLAFRIFYGFSSAVSKTRSIMMLNLAGLLFKIPLNLVFMYGYFGLPELGGVGCAVSTAVISWGIVIAAWYWCYTDHEYKRYEVFERWSWPDPKRIGHLVSLGLPIGLTFFIDVTAFTFMALFVAQLGPLNSAAHQITSNFAAILYMLPLAIGNAASVLAGQAIGGRDFARARSIGITGIAMAFGIGCFVGSLLYLTSGWIAAMYSPDAQVIAIAATLLSVVAVYHCLDAVQAVVINVLRGYKRALVPMFCNAFALWGLGLGGGYLIALKPVDLSWLGLFTPMGAKGFWIGAACALLVANTLVVFYFFRVSRKAVRNARLSA
ncbi:MAG: MATE family efflux transporter [Betaproteobacteria bacterium]|nr:MATE family efflux transporter [Betaproteobacteria bacterium]